MKHFGRVTLDSEGAMVSFAVKFTAKDLLLARDVGSDVSIREIKQSLEEGSYDFTLAFLRILMFDIEVSQVAYQTRQTQGELPGMEPKKKRKPKRRMKAR